MSSELIDLKRKLNEQLKQLRNKVTPITAPDCLKQAEHLVFSFNSWAGINIDPGKDTLGIDDDTIFAVDGARDQGKALAVKYLKTNALSLGMSYRFALKSPVFARLEGMYQSAVLLSHPEIAKSVRKAIDYNIDLLDGSLLKAYDHRQKKSGRDSVQLSLFSD